MVAALALFLAVLGGMTIGLLIRTFRPPTLMAVIGGSLINLVRRGHDDDLVLVTPALRLGCLWRGLVCCFSAAVDPGSSQPVWPRNEHRRS